MKYIIFFIFLVLSIPGVIAFINYNAEGSILGYILIIPIIILLCIIMFYSIKATLNEDSNEEKKVQSK